MAYFKKARNRIKSDRDERKRFFKEARAEIMEANLSLLRTGCFFGLLLILLFFFITPFIVKDWVITSHYICLLPVMIGFYLFTIFYEKTEKKNYYVVSAACVLFWIAFMSSIILIEVFSYPNTSESFMSICLTIMPVAFLLDLHVIASLMIIFETIFLFLCIRFKHPVVLPHDIFTTLAALLCGLMIAGIVVKLRVRDNQAKMKYKRLSTMDILTGIFNKTTCEQVVQEALNERVETDIYALLILDIDNFKGINDTLGHKMGDDILKGFGDILMQLFRSSDIIGRFGGDEFLVLMKNISGEEAVKKKAREIAKRLEGMYYGDRGKNITCSIGIAIAPGEYISFEDLFQLADDALYEAKAFGKGRFVVHHFLNREDKSGLNKIMVIADHAEKERMLLKDIFSGDYKILEAADGQEALEILSFYKEKIEVLILDMGIPGLDGFKMLEYMRSRPVYDRIPVLTLMPDKTAEEKALKKGASDMIVKPIDPAVIRLRICNLLKYTGSGI